MIQKNFKHHIRAVVFRQDELLVMERNKFGKRYRTLIGGGIEKDESPKQAIIREVLEETKLAVTDPVRVFTEISPKYKAVQHVFVCRYNGGDQPEVDEGSGESKLNKIGKNTYMPVWISLDQIFADINDIPFITQRLLDEIAMLKKNNFNQAPKEWTI